MYVCVHLNLGIFSMFKYFMFVLHLYTVISGVLRSMLVAATGPLLLIGLFKEMKRSELN